MTIIKTVTPDTKGIYLKLGIITTLVMVGFISYHFAAGKLKENGVVLGKKTQTDKGGEVLQTIQAYTQDAQKSAYGVTQQAAVTIGDTATRSAQIIKEYILNSTVENVVKQLDKLPDGEMERIKEYICK